MIGAELWRRHVTVKKLRRGQLIKRPVHVSLSHLSSVLITITVLTKSLCPKSSRVTAAVKKKLARGPLDSTEPSTRKWVLVAVVGNAGLPERSRNT